MKRVFIMALLYIIALSGSSIKRFWKQHQGEAEVEALYFKALRVPEVQDAEEDTSRGMLFTLQGTTTIVPVGQSVLVRHKKGRPQSVLVRHKKGRPQIVLVRHKKGRRQSVLVRQKKGRPTHSAFAELPLPTLDLTQTEKDFNGEARARKTNGQQDG